MVSLQASARSAYRSLWRASSHTFAGDATVLHAFREKMRTDAASWRTSSEAELKEQVELATNVAQYLRRNLAQIRRVDGTEDVWRLQLNEHHEIGDNSTIKSPPPVVVPPKGRRARAGQSQPLLFSMSWSSHRRLVTVASPNASSFTSETLGVIRPARYYATGRTGNQVKVDEAAAADDSRSDESAVSQSDDSDIVEGEGSTLSLEDTSKPVFYSQLKKLAKQRVVPTLNEDDLEEVFVRGHGPGGQSINKTNNNVQIIHRPTGIRVVCQETRSLELNRMYARRILVEKLDKLANPGLSKGEVQRAKQLERERRRRKRAKTNERDEEDRARRKALRKEQKRAVQQKDDDDDDDD